MSTDPLPTAMHAGPPPAPMPTAKKSLPWHVVVPAIVSTLSLCVGFSCGVPVGWMTSGKGGAGQGGGRGRHDDWTWQRLQDRLAEKGFKTERTEIKDGNLQGGMLFLPAEIAKAEEGAFASLYHQIEDGRAERSDLCKRGGFYARKYPSETDAKQEAARVKDVEQRDILAWGPFVVETAPETRKRLQALLP